MPIFVYLIVWYEINDPRANYSLGRVLLSRSNRKVELATKNSCFGFTISASQNRCAFSAHAGSEGAGICIIPKETLMRELNDKPGLFHKFYETMSKVSPKL